MGPALASAVPAPAGRHAVGMLGVGLLLALGLVGCDAGHPDGGVEAGLPWAVIDDGDPDPPLPDVPDEPVLRLTGPALAQANDGEDLLLDLAALERLPQVEITVFEPFVEVDTTFAGVLVEDLVDWASQGDAAVVDVRALDDYRITFTHEEVVRGQAILALREDGVPIPLSAAGPARVIFPDRSDVGDNRDLWIWSVASITLE